MDYQAKDYEFYFDKEMKVKNSGVFKCRDCKALWLIDIPSPHKICYRINAHWQLDLLEEWLANDTSAKHLKWTATYIGTSSPDYVEYPCKATLKSGEVRDLCILTK